MGVLQVLQPRTVGGLVAAGVVCFLVYTICTVVQNTIRTRRQYYDIPSPPRHWLLGNLKKLGEHMNPSNPRHPDYGMEEIWEELGRPPLFLLDIAPVSRSIIVVADPNVAEQIVQPTADRKYSCCKSDTFANLWRVTGAESMLTAEGEEWKSLRKRFSKGFSPAHLNTLSPLVASKTKIFVERLKAMAESGETFSLRDFSQDLVTDIITTIAIEKDFGSQSIPQGQGAKGPLGFLTASRKLPSLVYQAGGPFSLIAFLDPIRPLKALFYDTIQNRILDNLIWDAMKADQQETKAPTEKPKSAKAIVQLALSGMRPTKALVRNTRDQIKTFIFAGQDTTSTTIQWICYELSQITHSPRHAAYHANLCSEHDKIFGPATATTTSQSTYFSALDKLSDPTQAEQILGDKLPYTTAFIKEILRVHPPASTARLAPETLSIPNPKTNEETLAYASGLRVYNCCWLTQRHPDIWGPDAKEFNPSRWLDDEYVRNLPSGSWRPFERGPRSCIGQELAVMEMKVVLCAVARGLLFEKVGFTGRDGERPLFNVHQITSVPCDGMVMRVKMRGVGREERV